MSPATEAAQLSEQLDRLSAEIGQRKKRGESVAELVQRHQELSARRKQVTEQERPGEAAEAVGHPHEWRTDIITSLRPWQGLRQEYEDLLGRSDCISPFLTWQWLHPWFETFGAEYDLRLFVVRDKSDRLLAAAPMMLGRERWRLQRRRVLRFVGTGPGLRGNFFNFIADREHLAAATGLLLESVLTTGAEESELVILEHFSGFGDGMASLGQMLARPQFRAMVETEYMCVYADLPSSFEEFVQSVPSERRRTYLRRGDEKLRERFDVEYVLCRDEEELPRFLETLAHFNVLRMSDKGDTSTWEDERARECREAVARLFLAEGWLKLELLACDGEPPGALMGFEYRDRYFVYQMGFAPEYSEFAPLHCLFGHRIKRCIERGVSHFSFLAVASRYKREYSEKALPELSVTMPVGCSGEMKVGGQLLLQGGKAWLRELLGRSAASRQDERAG